VTGLACGPEKTGPPILWLLMLSVAPFFPPRSAVTTFGPSARPVTTPVTRPLARRANALDTSRDPTATCRVCADPPAGSTISTKASPPLIRSARLERVLICSAPVGPGVVLSEHPGANESSRAQLANAADIRNRYR